MTKLVAVVHNELVLHWTSFRFLLSSVLFVVLSGLVSLSGALDYKLRLETYQSQIERNRDELGAVSVYSYLQPLVLHPPEPLSIFERGFEGRLGNDVRIHVYSIPLSASGENHGNLFMASIREIDLTTIVQVVLGLQALLLTFDAVVGERERKNLSLILAQSVSRSSVIFGKFLGAFLALLIPLIASGLASVGLLIHQGGIELSSASWLRLGGLFGAYVLYLGIMLLLGLLLSLVAPSASKSLAYAILAWLSLVFLLPQLGTLTAGVLAEPGPDLLTVEKTIAGLDQDLEDRLQGIWREKLRKLNRTGHFASAKRDNWNRGVIHRFGSARYYDALASYYRQEISLGIQHAEEVFALRQAYEQQHKAPERLARVLTAFSPISLLESLAEALAGTSLAEHDAFLAASRAYREELIEYLHRKGAFDTWRWFTDDPAETYPWPATFLGMEPDEVNEANLGEVFNRMLDPEIQERKQRLLAETAASRLLTLDDLPPFRLETADLSLALRRVAPEWLLFLGIGSLLAASVALRFVRYEVE